MRPLTACCLAIAPLLIAGAHAATSGDAPFVLAQMEKPVQWPQRPQTPLRGGKGEQMLSQNPMAQQILKDPDQQEVMDDPRFQALIRDPRMQEQMQRNQQLRQMYQLQRRPLPGVSADDDDD